MTRPQQQAGIFPVRKPRFCTKHNRRMPCRICLADRRNKKPQSALKALEPCARQIETAAFSLSDTHQFNSAFRSRTGLEKLVRVHTCFCPNLGETQPERCKCAARIPKTDADRMTVLGGAAYFERDAIVLIASETFPVLGARILKDGKVFYWAYDIHKKSGRGIRVGQIDRAAPLVLIPAPADNKKPSEDFFSRVGCGNFEGKCINSRNLIYLGAFVGDALEILENKSHHASRGIRRVEPSGGGPDAFESNEDSGGWRVAVPEFAVESEPQ